jgi:hypothetical protein
VLIGVVTDGMSGPGPLGRPTEKAANGSNSRSATACGLPSVARLLMCRTMPNYMALGIMGAAALFRSYIRLSDTNK